MKQWIRFSAPGIFILLLSLVLVQEVRSQDYLDVPQGYETLNLLVEGDSLPNGSRNPNRVYRLENNGFYLINGALENSMNGGFPLHIEAAYPVGMPPVLVPATDESGSSTNIFDFVADGSVKGLYLSSLDQTANYVRNNLSLRQDSIKVVIDRCYFDYDRQAPLRCDAFEQKLFV